MPTCLVDKGQDAKKRVHVQCINVPKLAKYENNSMFKMNKDWKIGQLRPVIYSASIPHSGLVERTTTAQRPPRPPRPAHPHSSSFHVCVSHTIARTVLPRASRTQLGCFFLI